MSSIIKMKMQFEHYLPVVLAALTVIILGCWNPKAIQTTGDKTGYSGAPSYFALALAALIVGALTVLLINMKKRSALGL